MEGVVFWTRGLFLHSSDSKRKKNSLTLRGKNIGIFQDKFFPSLLYLSPSVTNTTSMSAEVPQQMCSGAKRERETRAIAHNGNDSVGGGGPRNRTEKYDLMVFMPIAFAGLLFKFASDFESQAVSLYLRKRGLEIALSTPGTNALVNILVNMSTPRYSVTELTPNGVLSSGTHLVHVNPKEMLKALELVKTGCESVRIKTGLEVQKILVEGGTMRRITEVGRPAAKKARKTTDESEHAAGEESELVWDSPAYARLPKVQAVAKNLFLKNETPPEAIVMRLSALYLYQRLKKAISTYKDSVTVTLSFVGRMGLRHPTTHQQLPPGVTEVQVEETEEELEKRMKCMRKGQSVPPKPMPYDAWIPTGLYWELNAAGSSIESSIKFSLVDRTQEYKAKALGMPPTSANGHTGGAVVDWNSEEVDVFNPLQGRTDRDLGLYEAGNTVAELLAFPESLTEPPRSWSYSANQLILVLGGSAFNRSATIHISNDESEPIEGALWFCYPLGNNGEAGTMHAIVGRLADIDADAS